MRNLNCKTFKIEIAEGVKLECAFMLARYVDNHFPFLGLIVKENDEFDFKNYDALSVNLGKLPMVKVADKENFLICFDSNNYSFAEDLLLSKGFAKNTGCHEDSGYCIYPVFEMDYSKIKPYVAEDIRDEY